MYSFDECECCCHSCPGVMHILACCSPCPICHRNIKFNLEKHSSACREERIKLMETCLGRPLSETEKAYYENNAYLKL